MKDAVPVRYVMTIQRAALGGHPLDNEQAHQVGIAHGMPLLIVSQRELVAFLKRVLLGDETVRREAEAMLRAWNAFVVEVDPQERASPAMKPTRRRRPK